MRSKKPNAGFTLPEVLTAVVIVGLVLVTLYSCWAAVLGATQSSTIAVQDAQRERMAIRAISDALAGVSWYEHRTEGPLHLDTDTGPSPKFTKFSRLKLISRVPSGFWGERELGNYPLRRIEFLTEAKPGGESQLVMIQHALLAPTNPVMLHRTVLLPRVETFTIEVLPCQPFDSQSWQTSWPLTDYQIEDLVEKWKALKAQADANVSTNDTDKLTDAANTLFETRGLPLQAKVTLGVIEGFPRKSTRPIFASQASHAKGAIIPTIDGTDFEKGGGPMDPDSESDSRIVFIIDKSSSMRFGKLDMAKGALMNTLRNLAVDPDNKSKFYIYFFDKNLDPQDAMRGTSTMRDVNDFEINNFSKWINEQVPARSRPKDWGDDGIVAAITGAFTHAPTDINLITDAGSFKSVAKGKGEDLPIADIISSKNAATDNPANVNVYIILNTRESIKGTDAEQVLMDIVGENGGKLIYIDP